MSSYIAQILDEQLLCLRHESNSLRMRLSSVFIRDDVSIRYILDCKGALTERTNLLGRGLAHPAPDPVSQRWGILFVFRVVVTVRVEAPFYIPCCLLVSAFIHSSLVFTLPDLG